MENDLFTRLAFFVDDLLTHNEQRLSVLSSVNPQYYFPRYYFTEDEIEYLLSFRLSNGLTFV
jgi:hypothetical protein